MKQAFLLFLILLVFTCEWGCEAALKVSPPSELNEDVLSTPSGIKSLLFSSYSGIQNGVSSRWYINASEVTTDLGFNTGGGENLTLSQLINFTWDASLGILSAEVWAPHYRAIRDANLILEKLPTAQISQATQNLYAAEAKLLRAYAYSFLYKWFGPVPLRTSSSSPTDMDRAKDDEIRNFIQLELLTAIPDLPDPGQEEAFGRANKGMAWGILAKYYLNTKQWQKAADAASKVIGFNYYQLFPDPTKMFTVANERNKEMILVIPCLTIDGYGNWYMAGALPSNFKTSSQIPEYTWVSGMANFATKYRLRSAFVNTFDFVNDKRAALILRTYVTTSGATVNLMDTPDNARCFKYWDNGTIGNNSGNDVPQIRYADILLTRAEALNELNGPTQESLDLINQVRQRAGISPLTLADATGIDKLRDLILRERGWEFVGEGLRREDLLRQGKFIDFAKARGIVNALDKHKLFPIPQTERDANKLLRQNEGY